MSIALLGLLGGFAKGASERIEKEREDNEELIKTRLKMAALNKDKRDKELDARRTALEERLALVSPYFETTGDLEQDEKLKLGLISSPEIAKQFAERAQSERVDPTKFLVLNDKLIPAGFTSVKEYIASLTQKPAAATEEQMKAAFDQEGFLGAKTGVGMKKAEKIAGALGAGSAAELLAYEKTEPLADPLLEMAKVNVTLFPRAPKTLDEQTTQQASVVSAIIDQFGEESAQAKEAVTRWNTLLQRKRVLDPEQQTYSAMLDALKKTALTSEDPDERDKAKKMLEEAARLGKAGEGRKLPSAMSMNNLLKDAASKAVSSEFGQLIGSGIVIGTATDEGGNTFNTYRYVGGNPQEQARIEATARKAMKNVVDTWLDLDGNPLSEDIATALAVNGILRDKDGRFQWAVPTPPPVVTQTPTRTEQPSQGLAARPQPATAAQPAQPARASVNIAEARRNAQAAIAQGADAAAVRKRFKEMTGQDF